MGEPIAPPEATGGGSTSATEDGGGGMAVATNSGGDESGGGPGNGGMGGIAEGGAGGEGGEGGSGPPAKPVCDQALPLYDGPLCGPGYPCLAEADEFADTNYQFRNGQPSIAVDGDCRPHLGYSHSEGGHNAKYARRNGANNWFVEFPGFAYPRTEVAVTINGVAYLLGNDFGKGTYIHDNSDGGVWSQGSAFPNSTGLTHNTPNFFLDESGNFQTVLFDGAQDRLVNASFGGMWSFTDTFGGDLTSRFASGMEPASGAMHTIHWRFVSPAFTLFWATPNLGLVTEKVMDTGSSSLGSLEQKQAVAVSAPDAGNPHGQPRVLMGYKNNGTTQLHYYWRVGKDNWSNTLVAAEEPNNYEYCNFEPSGPNDTCDYDYHDFTPIAVVTTPGAEVRFLWVDSHKKGTYETIDFGGGNYYFVGGTDNSSGALMVSWVDEFGEVGSQPLDDVDTQATSGGVALDRTGRIHVALFEPGDGGTALRYVAMHY